MKIIELPLEFEGKGESQRSYHFIQKMKNDIGYIYEKKAPETQNPIYEIFRRILKDNVIVTRANNKPIFTKTGDKKVAYPHGELFGSSAWTTTDWPHAVDIFNDLENKCRRATKEEKEAPPE